MSVGGGRAAEDHVVAVTQRHRFGNGIGVLGHRQAFAGERGLGGLQGGRFQQPSIGRDGVAFLDQDDVAGTIAAAGMLRRSPLRMTVASAADMLAGPRPPPRLVPPERSPAWR